ncbi:unnamed protein product [Brassica rapa subsp. trilocularis]
MYELSMVLLCFLVWITHCFRVILALSCLIFLFRWNLKYLFCYL